MQKGLKKGYHQSLSGRKFNRLMVIEEAGRYKNRSILWLCRCDCGKIKKVLASSLLNGDVQSCGCLKKELLGNRCRIHGQSGYNITTEYMAWQNIKKRCYNTKADDYYRYGGRGIKVCDRWLESFENFFEDMGTKPTPDHSLDRFPNNETGDYEPGNCRWGTDEQQSRNKRTNVWIEYNGEKMILKDWSIRLGICYDGIRQYLKKGYSFDWIVTHFKKQTSCYDISKSDEK